jgi:chromosome partitioning protein
LTFGTQGLRVVHQAVDHARQMNSGLRLLGHVVTRADRRLLVHQAYEKRLRSLYGDLVLETVIPEASAFKVALACRQPVGHSSPRCKAAQATRALCWEKLERVAEKTNKRQVA